MRKNYFLFVVGLIVFSLQFLGFPKTLDIFLYAISGLVIMGMAVVEYIKYRLKKMDQNFKFPARKVINEKATHSEGQSSTESSSPISPDQI